MAEYNRILGGLGSLPTGSYEGELVAPVNAQQMAGVGGINNYANFAQPGISGAMGYAEGAAQPLTEDQIRQYMNPYISDVVNSTQQAMNLQRDQGLSALRGNAAAQGALGGNRVGVAEANYTSEHDARVAPVIAGLYSQGYGQALQTANQQFQQNPMQAAGLYGNLALAGQQAGLAGGQAQIGAGTLMQQTDQAQNTANLQNWLLPYQQYGSQAQIAAGVGSQMGGYGTQTGTTTAPAPNPWSQIAGLGVAALGAFSDERLKEDIEKVGELKDGQPIYRYRFKGSPKWEIGLIAQDVEQSHPEAVGVGPGNMRMVDYKAATDDAVERWRGGPVAGFAAGGAPSSPFTVSTSLPGVSAPQAADWRQHLRFLEPAKVQSDSYSPSADQLKGAAGGLGKVGAGIRDWWNTGTPLVDYAPEQNTSHPNYGVGPELPQFYGTGAGTGIMPRTSGLFGFRSGGGVRGYEEGGVPTMAGVSGGFAPPIEEEIVPAPLPRPTFDPMDRYARAISSIESSNKYDAVGPQTRTGDRAYGKYQVMGANIPEWTRTYYGKTLTAPEFLADPAAQDAVFKGKFGTYADKYGPTGAAKAWFAGERGMRDPNRRDQLGTSVAAYGDKFSRAAGLGPETSPAMMASAIPGITPKDRQGLASLSGSAAMPFADEGGMIAMAPQGEGPASFDDRFNAVSGVAPMVPPARTPASVAQIPPSASSAPAPISDEGELPPEAQLTSGVGPSIGGGSGLFNMSEEARLGMIAAGLGMMASRSPYLGVGLGEGGLQGLKTYREARGSRRLEEQARVAQRKLDETERHARQKEMLEAGKPFKIGMDQMGRDIYAIRGADGRPIPIDPLTGVPMLKPDTVSPQSPAAPSTKPTAPATPGVGPNTPMVEDDSIPKEAQYVSGQVGMNDPIATVYQTEALDGLAPGDANRVRAIAEGRMPAMALRGRNDVYNRMIMDKVLQYNPAYDNTIYASRQRTANEFKVGVAARNLTATKTLAGHLEDLYGLAKELDNTDIPALNRLQQGFQRETGWDKKRQELIKRYEAQAKVVADEGAKVFAGAQSALADRQEWEKIFDVSAGKAAQMGSISQIVKQIDSRLDALASQYNNGMMTSRQPSDMVDKKTKEIFDRLRNVSSSDEKPAGDLPPGVPAGSKSGTTKSGKKVWQTPDGKLIPRE